MRVARIDEAGVAARGVDYRAPLPAQCASGYPAPPASNHRRTIPHLAALTGCAVGLSSHTNLVEHLCPGYIVRPAHLWATWSGLSQPPKFLPRISGRQLARNAARGTPAALGPFW